MEFWCSALCICGSCPQKPSFACVSLYEQLLLIILHTVLLLICSSVKWNKLESNFLLPTKYLHLCLKCTIIPYLYRLISTQLHSEMERYPLDKEFNFCSGPNTQRDTQNSSLPLPIDHLLFCTIICSRKRSFAASCWKMFSF